MTISIDQTKKDLFAAADIIEQCGPPAPEYAQARVDLLVAADLIEQRGHCKRAYQDARGCLCAAGALQVAITGVSFADPGDGELRPIIDEIVAPGMNERYAVACLLARRQVKKEHPRLHDIISFNEREQTTGADVAALLRRAAEGA